MWLNSVFEIKVAFTVYNVTIFTISCQLLCQLPFGNCYGGNGECGGILSEPHI